MGIVNCMHVFHKECISLSIKAKIKNNELEILCPMDDCLKKLSVEDMHTFLDKSLITKYYELTFKEYVSLNHKDTSWCPTPNCNAVFMFLNNTNYYECPACKIEYCLKCRVQFHTGLTCQQFKDKGVDKSFEEFVKGAKFKQCPQCNYWVEKASGCNHMTCRCKKQFCYLCG